MRKTYRLFLVILALFGLSIFAAFAQDNEAYIFVNETNQEVDEAAIRETAQTLIDNHQAQVAIFMVISGSEEDFTARLEANNWATDSETSDNVFAIYIATEEQYSEIRWGAGLDNINGDTLRSNYLNPMLRARDFRQAMVNTLNAADAQLSNIAVPDIRTPTNYSSPSSSEDVAFPLFIGLFFVVVIVHQIYNFIKDPEATMQSWTSGSSYDNNTSSSYSSRNRSSSRSSHRSRVSSSSRSSSRSSRGGSSGGSWKD